MDKAVGRSRVHIYLENTKTTKKKTSELSVMDKAVRGRRVHIYLTNTKEKENQVSCR